MISIAGAAEVANLAPTAILALIVAPMVGLAAMVVRLFAESGRVRLSLVVLRRSKADLLTVVSYDVVGGALVVLAVVLLGATRPPALIEALNHHPMLAWPAVGVIGPMLGATFVDRLPLRPLLDRAGRTPNHDLDVGQAIMSEGRFKATTRVREQLYTAVQIQQGIERDKHRQEAVQLVMEGCLGWDMIEEDIQRFARRWGRRVPDPLRLALDRKKAWPVAADPGSDTILLVYAATSVGWSRPVAVSCGRAAALRAAQDALREESGLSLSGTARKG